MEKPISVEEYLRRRKNKKELTKIQQNVIIQKDEIL